MLLAFSKGSGILSYIISNLLKNTPTLVFKWLENMIITDIESQLLRALSGADEVWIAVALINDAGFQKLQDVLQNTKQYYLIGVDLPTTPTVLYELHQKLQAGMLEARLAKYDTVFHPKVFIARKADRVSAIIGSANLTEHGLRHNHELCYTITDQEHTQELIRWFQGLYAKAYPLTIENIREYENHYSPSNEKNSATLGNTLNFTRPSTEELFFERRDLSGYFFKESDYLAFRQNIQADRGASANQERKKVWDKFKDLHEIIFPQFRNYGIGVLDHNRREDYIVSHYFHADGYTAKLLNAMWLSYGKNRGEIEMYQALFPKIGREQDEERDRQSFSNHSRIQIRIELGSLGIWILFAKNNGSEFDRHFFREEMHKSQFRHIFYQKLQELSEPYWIRINSIQYPVSYFQTPEDLHNFTKTDNSNEYFVIGRDYDITDPALRESQIPTTVLEELERLFPLFDMMRHRL